MVSNPCIEVQTSPEDRPSVPEWFAEVVMIARHLATKGLIEAFAQQVRLVRGRFGSYEPIDFLGPLVGYALSGERTLADFFERVDAARHISFEIFAVADQQHDFVFRAAIGLRQHVARDAQRRADVGAALGNLLGVDGAQK